MINWDILLEGKWYIRFLFTSSFYLLEANLQYKILKWMYSSGSSDINMVAPIWNQFHLRENSLNEGKQQAYSDSI